MAPTTNSHSSSNREKFETEKKEYTEKLRNLLDIPVEGVILSDHNDKKSALSDFHKKFDELPSESFPENYISLLASLADGRKEDLNSLTVVLYKKLFPHGKLISSVESEGNKKESDGNKKESEGSKEQKEDTGGKPKEESEKGEGKEKTSKQSSSSSSSNHSTTASPEIALRLTSLRSAITSVCTRRSYGIPRGKRLLANSDTNKDYRWHWEMNKKYTDGLPKELLVAVKHNRGKLRIECGQIRAYHQIIKILSEESVNTDKYLQELDKVNKAELQAKLFWQREEERKQKVAQREEERLQRLKKQQEKQKEKEQRLKELEQKKHQKEKEKQERLKKEQGKKEEAKRKREDAKKKKDALEKKRKLEAQERKEKDAQEKKKRKITEESPKKPVTHGKEAKMFMSFFSPKKKTPSKSRRQTVHEQERWFRDVEVNSKDTKIAPIRRKFRKAGQGEHHGYLKCGADKISREACLDYLKTGSHRTSYKRRRKMKFLQFHENYRPAFFGHLELRQRQSNILTARNFLKKDSNIFDYSVDSDEEWDDEEEGEDLQSENDDMEEDIGEDGEEQDWMDDEDNLVPQEDKVEKRRDSKLGELVKVGLCTSEMVLNPQTDSERKAARKLKQCAPIKIPGTHTTTQAYKDLIRSKRKQHKYVPPHVMVVNNRIVVNKQAPPPVPPPVKRKTKVTSSSSSNNTAQGKHQNVSKKPQTPSKKPKAPSKTKASSKAKAPSKAKVPSKGNLKKSKPSEKKIHHIVPVQIAPKSSRSQKPVVNNNAKNDACNQVKPNANSLAKINTKDQAKQMARDVIVIDDSSNEACSPHVNSSGGGASCPQNKDEQAEIKKLEKGSILQFFNNQDTPLKKDVVMVEMKSGSKKRDVASLGNGVVNELVPRKKQKAEDGKSLNILMPRRVKSGEATSTPEKDGETSK